MTFAMHGKQSTVLRPHGIRILASPDGQIEEADTLQCCHCGAHFPVNPGSKKVRGFCTRCNGPICGPGCAECVPQEEQLENLEAGRPAKTPGRILVPKPRLILP